MLKHKLFISRAYYASILHDSVHLIMDTSTAPAGKSLFFCDSGSSYTRPETRRLFILVLLRKLYTHVGIKSMEQLRLIQNELYYANSFVWSSLISIWVPALEKHKRSRVYQAMKYILIKYTWIRRSKNSKLFHLSKYGA